MVTTSVRTVLSAESTSLAMTTGCLFVFILMDRFCFGSLDKPLAKHFVLLRCDNTSLVGPTCNVSSSPCNMLNPCRNNGTCFNNGTEPHGVFCSCPTGFNGTQCQLDHRTCKPNTCWNKGIKFSFIIKQKSSIFFVGQCNETENGAFICTCQPGWHDTHCQTMIDYCETARCKNKGVCRRLLGGYKCECLYGYSGDHCEITATEIVVYKTISKSFAYIAIIAMVSVAMFIIVMDILKYCFGIDPTREELERIRRNKQAKKRKPVIQRFIYVNPPSTEEPVSTVAETVV